MADNDFHVRGLEGSRANQMRRSSRIVAISLVGCERLERLMGLPALDANPRGGRGGLDVFTNSPATAAARRRHLDTAVNGPHLRSRTHMRKNEFLHGLPPPKSEETRRSLSGSRCPHSPRWLRAERFGLCLLTNAAGVEIAYTQPAMTSFSNIG